MCFHSLEIQKMAYFLKKSDNQSTYIDGPYPNKKEAKKARTVWIKAIPMKKSRGFTRKSYDGGDLVIFSHAVWSSVSFEIYKA